MLGRWWHKDKEIDLVALNNNENKIFFIECKWMDLSQGRTGQLFGELQEKSIFVDWKRDAQKHYVIIAKKVENKKFFRKEGFYVFDKDDMSKIMG